MFRIFLYLPSGFFFFFLNCNLKWSIVFHQQLITSDIPLEETPERGSSSPSNIERQSSSNNENADNEDAVSEKKINKLLCNCYLNFIFNNLIIHWNDDNYLEKKFFRFFFAINLQISITYLMQSMHDALC